MNDAKNGLQCFFLSNNTGIHTFNNQYSKKTLSPDEILALTPLPNPLIEFAAHTLSTADTSEVASLDTGSISLRYRVRGPGQCGTLLATSDGTQELMRIDIDSTGITYLATTSTLSSAQRKTDKKDNTQTFHAAGTWDDGNWHDIVLTVGHGAVRIYVNGYLESHLPGRPFFHTDTTSIVLGQDTYGKRLFGEVASAAIYSTTLNDAQIKHLSRIKPIRTVCLFDKGYNHSASYRIPALLTTTNGTLIAAADQRVTIPNDAPNGINLVMRRSSDNGVTWSDMATIVEYPGRDHQGAAATDISLINCADTGRIIALFDLFPGTIGQPQSTPGRGVTKEGLFELYDNDGNTFVWCKDGYARPTRHAQREDPRPHHREPRYLIAENGDVTSTDDDSGAIEGNVFLADSAPFHIASTSFLQMIYSDDDGHTWSQPRNLNHQVKDDWMDFLGTGPGRGIQIRHGKYAGRIVAPVYYSGKAPMEFICAVVYSDDNGETWHRGGGTDPMVATYEATVIERSDASLLMLMRNQHSLGKVATACSYNGGLTWSDIEFDPALPEIFSQPNAINVPCKTYPDRVIFANASQLMPYRGHGKLRLSHDGGKTWAASRTFNPAHYVYQCMTVLPDGTLGLLWERETQGLYFSVLPLSWFGISTEV